MVGKRATDAKGKHRCGGRCDSGAGGADATERVGAVHVEAKGGGEARGWTGCHGGRAGRVRARAVRAVDGWGAPGQWGAWWDDRRDGKAGVCARRARRCDALFRGELAHLPASVTENRQLGLGRGEEGGKRGTRTRTDKRQCE